ncbi:hypothetical protein ABZV78_25305 [Micromonospora sp. NPDC004540]|uniref:hypothetical protein n=1 Tax=Micromonospora sp. NPDC004540 TaxID=3154457 RepID=UPI0033BE6CD2
MSRISASPQEPSRNTSRGQLRVPRPRQPNGASGAAAARLIGMTSLKQAIRTVPVPGAPPPLSREAAAVGLAFLDMALRQNHIRRLTERLSLVEHGLASRTTEVDVRLSLLNHGQREASQLFQRLSSRSARSREEEQNASPTIWVPVTRISRLSVSPVDVVDAAGTKLPRLTQYETSRLLASGLYRLLAGTLSSQPETRQDSPLSQLLFHQDQARWLIQAALIALLTERSRSLTTGGDDRGEPHDDHDDQRCRALALSVLRDYEQQLVPYANLLDVAVNDYLLVAALDLTRDDHLLSYDAPVHTRTERAAADLDPLRRSSPARYQVRYVARIPASLRSYHVVAETEPGVHIEAMSMVTNADESTAKDLTRDLRSLAERWRKPRPGIPARKRLLELELQSALGRLSELVRTRRWDASQAGLDLPDSTLRKSRQLSRLYLADHGLAHSERDNQSLLDSAALTADDLELVAREVEEQQVGSDFSVENDPASSRAHAYWRRSSSRTPRAEHTTVVCTLRLRDATGARPGSVMAYALVVAATVYLVGCLLDRSLWPYDSSAEPPANADAVVAVLLLVPGFLYTRLDLPLRHTILGHLRWASRWLAHLSIGSAVLAAAAVASGVGSWLLTASMGVATGLPLLAALLLGRPAGQQRSPLAVRLSAPRWLQPPGWREVPPDAVFYSSGSDHE